jgi:hypothetical protein
MKTQIARMGTALLVAVALSATAASAAQAHDWTIEGSSLTKLGLASEKLSFSKPTEFQFQFTSIGTGILSKWNCQVTFTEGSIKSSGKGGMQATLSKCIFRYSSGKECSLNTVTNPPLVGELIEAGGVLYEKFTPSSGETVFGWTMGSDCNTPGLPIFATGNFAMRIASAKTSQIEHAFETSGEINSSAGGALNYGGMLVKLTASYVNALAGTNAGKKWAAE